MIVGSTVYLAVAGVGTPPSDLVATTGTEEDLPTTVVEARGGRGSSRDDSRRVAGRPPRLFPSGRPHADPVAIVGRRFKELARTWQVNVHWLAVNAEAMNVDNKPRDDFKEDAVKALASGKPEFEAVEGDVYRFAGSIRLASQCLKCHVPGRTSTEDRAAGLVISMPLRTTP